jgi:hypothetical protein
MDGTYKEFIKGGEIRYSQKPDTIGVYPGRNRVKAWLAVSSANVSKFKVYWNNRADSVEVPVVKTSKVDTVGVMIENLAEGSYTFEFLTYDREGNSSIAVDTVGEAFGDLYMNSLSNRLVRSASMLNNEVEISWFDENNDQVVETEVRYKSQDGIAHLIKVGADVNETKINERPLKGSLEYRTVFRPHPDAVDTFYTSYLPLSPITVYVGFPENFEDTRYAKTGTTTTEDIETGSGLWRFDKFLIGTVAADRKNGARSVRSYTTQTSSLEMLYDLPDGASKISFYHAICSSDAANSFKVQYSKNQGATWQDISEVQSTSIVLAYKEFELNIEGPVRFRFHQVSATGVNVGRSNIDDIDIRPSLN